MKILILLLSVCIASLSHAQRNYKDGFIIKTNGDTVIGQIDYREWNENPEKISFRPGGSGNEEIITLEDCTAFGLTYIDVHYEKHTVKLEVTYVDKIKYYVMYPDSSVIKTMFLEKIYNGKTYDLYRSYDNREHFFIGQNGKVDELLVKYWRSPEAIRQGNEQFSILNVYRDQLKQYFNWKENQSLLNKLEKTDYEERELIKFFELLDGGGKQPRKRSASRIGLFLKGGIQLSNVNSVDPSKDQRSYYKTNGVSNPVFGGGLVLSKNEDINHFYLGFGVSIASMSYTGERYVKIVSPSQEELEKYSVKHSRITFSPFIGYNIVLGKDFSLKPQIAANWQFLTRNELRKDVYNYVNGEYKRSVAYQFKKSTAVPVSAALIVSWKQSLELGAEKFTPYHISQLTTQSSKISTMGLFARYLFTL